MGGSLSTTGNASLVSRCDGKETNMDGPPPMRKVLTVEEKIWAKV